jgi:hypothetical protein
MIKQCYFFWFEFIVILVLTLIEIIFYNDF